VAKYLGSKSAIPYMRAGLIQNATATT